MPENYFQKSNACPYCGGAVEGSTAGQVPLPPNLRRVVCVSCAGFSIQGIPSMVVFPLLDKTNPDSPHAVSTPGH